MHYLLEQCSVLLEHTPSKRHQAAVDSGSSSSSSGGRRQHVRHLASMMQFLVAQMHGYLDGDNSLARDTLPRIAQFNESGRKAVVDLVIALQKL
jgi:hypothetical protein